MIIYEFTTLTFGEPDDFYVVKEYEVEEKPLSYIGERIRVLKSEIDKLQTNISDRMFRLDNDPKPYIEALITKKQKSINQNRRRIARLEAEISKLQALKID